MRAGEHDPPEDRDDGAADARPEPGAPRFARLVRAPAARRLSPRRLVIALVAFLVVGAAVVEGLRRGGRGIVTFVADQPEHRIRFDSIELVPPPPPYIARGAAGILEDVRLEGRYGETIPLLATDLEALRVDLSRNQWLEEVRAVRSSYRHLAAEVVYRRPLALIELGRKDEGTVIDRNGVELPIRLGQLAWAEERPGRYRPAGEPRPLISIRGLGLGLPDRVGKVWKSADPAVGPGRVLEAARLAGEVAARLGSRTPGGRAMPDFAEVQFRGERSPVAFALRESGDGAMVWWGSAPGRESDGEPPAARKWELLAAYIDAQPAPAPGLAPGTCLRFRFDRAEPVRAPGGPAPAPTTGAPPRPRARK